jgi:hypothetical protein
MANAQLSNEPKNVQNGDLEMNQRHQNNLMKYLRHPVYRMKALKILGLKSLKIFKNACILKNFSHKICCSKKFNCEKLSFYKF